MIDKFMILRESNEEVDIMGQMLKFILLNF